MKIYEISGKCRLSFAEETPGAECENLTIDAVIPGNVELDLERAGILPELFFGNNVTTGIKVAQARGVILLAVQQANVPIFEYKPMQVKQAVVGYGNASKHQVMDMTKRILHLSAVPKPDDAADAVAIALCHARSSTSLLALARK